MPKIQKNSGALPKNIQLTFITVAAIAFVVNAVYWCALLMRVYPNGMRLSQFSVMAIGLIVLPAILLGISLLKYKRTTPLFERVFNAALLTFVGLGIHQVVSVIERLLSRYQDISSSLLNMTWSPAITMLVSICLFVGLILVVNSRKKQNPNSLRYLFIATLFFVTIAFVVNAVFNFGGLVAQHMDSNNIARLLTHPMLLTPLVLPIAFFATAYLATSKVSGRMHRLFTALIYAMIGSMIILITTMLFNFGVHSLAISKYTSVRWLDVEIIFTTLVSLGVYTFLIVTHTKTKKISKKTK